MTHAAARILVVDDDAYNRDILQEYLIDAGYGVTLAEDGERAWEELCNDPHFSVLLLDRMMPRLDGMGLLARLRADARFSGIPVIFQTALADPVEVAAGLAAGAFYYLTKPFRRNDLLAIVQAALNHAALLHGVHEHAQATQSCLGLLRRAEFRLRTLAQARQLSHVLASLCPDPARASLGISELLINAVEHGNLGIGYAEKSSLVRAQRWEAEIERRLALPEYAGKTVTVELERGENTLTLTITDQGTGFDWQPYLEMAPQRAFDPNGRGIAMSRMLCFGRLEYRGQGNQVVAEIRLEA
jgi:DNA-binding response OmpR family regulator